MTFKTGRHIVQILVTEKPTNENQQKLCLFNFRVFLGRIINQLFYLKILALFDARR